MSSPSKLRHMALLPYLVAATFFMEYLDTTVAATALPQMARDFGVNPNALSIGMSAYMLALAVFIPVSGWIADRFGSRTVFGTAIALFTLASIWCGLSNGTVEFTLARLVQGIGGAMMVPVGRLVVVRNTERSELMKAIATITWPGVVAPVVGPPIGGFITAYASWRWVFLLNIPFGLAALAAMLVLLPNQKGDQRRPMDWGGFALCGATLTCVLYAAELAGQPHAPVWQAPAFLAAGIALAVLAWQHARGREHPLIDFSVMKLPTFSVTVISGSFTRIGLGAMPYLLPLLFQIGFGMSAFKSGILLLISATGNLGMKSLITTMLRRYGFRPVSIVAVAIGSAAVAACGFLTVSTSLVWVSIPIFIYGAARSTLFSTLSTLAYADVPGPQVSNANTLWSAAQQMTIGMGIAYGALTLHLGSVLLGDAGAVHFTPADFRFAFCLAGALIAVSVIGYLRLPANAGERLGGRQAARGAPAAQASRSDPPNRRGR